MCSEKDYDAIARLLAEQVYNDKLQADGIGDGVDLTALIEGIADYFAQKYGTFNSDKFESAVYAPVADRVGLQREI